MSVTDTQIQGFSDTQIRPLCESAETLYLKAKQIKSQIDDIYQNLAGTPTWSDGRTDYVPHLATPSDILAMNAWITDFIAFYEGDGSRAILEKLVVRNLIAG